MIRQREKAEAITAALREARDRSSLRDFIGEVELYCEGDGCAAREVTIVLKETDGPATRGELLCPACGAQLKLHSVRTLDEVDADDELSARMSVNEQRYWRDHPDHLAVPISVVIDDRLPA